MSIIAGPRIAELLTIDIAEVRARRETDECGLMEAKQSIVREKIIASLKIARDTHDISAILLKMMETNII